MSSGGSVLQEIESLIEFAFETQSARYIATALVAVLAWDIIITFDREIELVWRKKWTIGKAAYLLLRYPLLVFLSIYIMYVTNPNVSLDFCKRTTQLQMWFSSPYYLLVQVILILRTLALYEMNKILAVFLGAMVTATTVLSNYFIAGAMRSIPPMGDTPQARALVAILGCNAYFSSNDGKESTAVNNVGNYVVIMAFDTTLVTLLVLRALREARSTRGKLLALLVRDGFIYYFVILAASITSTIGMTRSTVQLSYFIITHLFMGVMASRITLNVREAAHRMDNANNTVSKTTLPDMFSARPGRVEPGSATVPVSAASVSGFGVGTRFCSEVESSRMGSTTLNSHEDSEV